MGVTNDRLHARWRNDKHRDQSARRASIHDVAESAGVSIKTVSRVLNREPNVADATRARVMTAVKELSYRPNLFARGLASVRSYLIGLVYDNPSASYVAGLQFGALQRCRAEGYHLIIEVVDSSDPDVGAIVTSLINESVLHGLILTPPLGDSPAILAALDEAGARYVRIAPGSQEGAAPSVSIDDRAGAYDMTKYLIGLGHRRIGFIKGHPQHGAARVRFDGYGAAMREAGLSVSEELCAQGQFSYQSGLAAADQLLALKTRPTAIFAANDDMAAAVLATAQRFHLAVPDDLSVAGFDDSLLAQVVWPQLTTCRQPIAEMASEAVSLLVQTDAEEAGASRRLDHELVIRQSTAPPR